MAESSDGERSTQVSPSAAPPTAVTTTTGTTIVSNARTTTIPTGTTEANLISTHDGNHRPQQDIYRPAAGMGIAASSSTSSSGDNDQGNDFVSVTIESIAAALESGQRQSVLPPNDNLQQHDSDGYIDRSERATSGRLETHHGPRRPTAPRLAGATRAGRGSGSGATGRADGRGRGTSYGGNASGRAVVASGSGRGGGGANEKGINKKIPGPKNRCGAEACFIGVSNCGGFGDVLER